MSQLQLGERGEKVASFIKYASVVAVGFAASMFVWQAAMGLIGLAVIFGSIYLFSAAAPWLSLKVANFVMGRFIAEVWKNPVLTRKNIEKEMKSRLDAEENDLLTQNSAVTDFESKVQVLEKKFPQDAKKFQDQLRMFKESLEEQYTDLSRGKAALKSYQNETERVEAIWTVAETGNKLARLNRNRQQRDALLKIASDESIKAADVSLAESQARLDHNRRLRASENYLSLENTPSPNIPSQQTQFVEVVTK